MMNGAESSDYPARGAVKDTMVRGICPEGWHVPSDAEWTALTDYVKGKTEYQCGGNADNIANALSSPTGWNNSSTSGCNAGDDNEKRNLTGFAAVPAGRCFNGNFLVFGRYAYFWSATQDGGGDAWCRVLNINNSGAGSRSDGKFYGFSVRCVRD